MMIPSINFSNDSQGFYDFDISNVGPKEVKDSSSVYTISEYTSEPAKFYTSVLRSRESLQWVARAYPSTFSHEMLLSTLIV